MHPPRKPRRNKFLPASQVRLSKILEEEKSQFAVGKIGKNKVPRISVELKDVALLEGGASAVKKIERHTSDHCQKSEYLTLLNSFENATTRDRQGAGEYH